ncbi:hypothetical protein SDRG_03579 [Saprolegnia diclina VS20]|uniref:Major facilitator superfamily (MFS) profile domain-containing protein n=1 Tax=Saprolegnia diclina (strain VS20) TaxID=1156394 RepID=T0S9H9_SAPDV|nr:hypothetical protein SDRG_03579 [Saprolegnia diclina VS20]EQC39377.1 hypothetical protein SDRG_03579 [Saprolegnia diclina VS20]|eukprot:XP_008607438.1 hypothetical protein SDRG_03579 [Saprolegnia diclina VS20]
MASVQDPSGDLVERLSYAISATKPDDYHETKTPVDLEDGALVAGGAVRIFSREAMALFSQYFAIGIVYGMIPALKYPVFNNYLYMEGYQTTAYGVLVTLGWSFKVFYGMLSDCVPIFGYRRKPWIILGWTVAAVSLLIMVFTPFAAPFCDRRINKCPKKAPKRESLTPTQLLQYNYDAPDSGTLFIALSVLTAFGYVLADVASDAMVVQYAQREPIAIRGRTQTMIYIVRYCGQMVAQLCVAFLLNGKVYAGSFNWSTTPNVLYAICLVPIVLVIPSTIFLLVEVKVPRTPFKSWLTAFWNLLQQRVMWQVCAFKFFNTLFGNFGATPEAPVAQSWALVEPLNESLSGLFGTIISIVVMSVVGKWGLQWSWRWVIALGTLGIIAIDAFVMMMTIWEVYRNQWFYTGVALAENVPSGIRFIVATYCAVEIADIGNEGATYGLVTTVSNLSGPVASAIYKIIDSFFDVSQDDIGRDDTRVRWEVTYTFLIAYAAKLFALSFLVLLPRQKAEMQELKRTGTKSKVAGGILIGGFLVLLVFSCVANFLSIYPSTKCYRIVGGKGYFANGTCKS